MHNVIKDHMVKVFLFFFHSFFIFLYAKHSEAALQKINPVAPYKSGKFLSQGVFIGGKVGADVSLINIKRKPSRDGRKERVLIEMGNKEGLPLTHNKEIGYFHAQIQELPYRLIIDFSQMEKSSLNEDYVSNLFKNSLFIKNISLTSDPENNSTNLTFIFNSPIKIEFFLSPNKKKRLIVVDVVKKSHEKINRAQDKL